VSLSSATSVSSMVLAYYSTTLPPGHVLQAGAIGPDGQEAEAHTSSARSFSYDNDSGRWDLPETFAPEHLRSAAEQMERLKKRGSVLVNSGQRTWVFSVTNDVGEIYRGFFELLGPPSDTTK